MHLCKTGESYSQPNPTTYHTNDIILKISNSTLKHFSTGYCYQNTSTFPFISFHLISSYISSFSLPIASCITIITFSLFLNLFSPYLLYSLHSYTPLFGVRLVFPFSTEKTTEKRQRNPSSNFYYTQNIEKPIPYFVASLAPKQTLRLKI